MSIFTGTWLEGSWVDDGLSWGFDKLDDVGESVTGSIGSVLDGASGWFNDNSDDVMGGLVNKWMNDDSEPEKSPNINADVQDGTILKQDNTILWIGGAIALVVVVVLFITMKK